MQCLEKLTNWLVKNKKEFLILLTILLVGSFLRLYKISEYMTFLGDEGRDAIVVRRLLVYADPILIGPGTSIGNMYLGPLYYYLIAPSLFIANYSPVGPAFFVAFLGVITIALVWWVGREWFGSWAGLISALLYAISPTVIIYSRSSWNPNIMPFFALATIWSIWKFWQEEKFKWLTVVGVSMAFVLQSHYLGLLLIPVVSIFWFLSLVKAKKQKKSYILYTLCSILIFSFLMSPLVIFDARHGWRNFEAIKKFFLERQATVSARPWNALPKIIPLLEKSSTSLLSGRNEIIGKWVSVVVVFSGLILAGKSRLKITQKEHRAFALLFIWLGFALFGLGLYKQEIYEHYFGFFFPAPFILIAGILTQLLEKAKIRGRWLVGTAVLVLVFYNLSETPLKYPPNRQLQRTIEISQKIFEEARDTPFNLAVIAERNYEDAYQYFLEKWGAGVVDIDPLRYQQTITNQLFVVCEMPKDKCDPTHNPKAEIANFGWSRVESEWDVAGVTIYKLVHSR